MGFPEGFLYKSDALVVYSNNVSILRENVKVLKSREIKKKDADLRYKSDFE